MKSWLQTDSAYFLSDRYFLYEVCEACAAWGERPSRYLEFHLEFSPFICMKLDNGLAQFRLWYTSRMEARRKVGKYGQEAKYKTLDAVLGIRDANKLGDFASEEDLADATDAYMLAVVEASKQGKPTPDIEEWLANRDATEVDFRIKGDDDGGWDW